MIAALLFLAPAPVTAAAGPVSPSIELAIHAAMDPCRNGDPADGITVCGHRPGDPAQQRFLLPEMPDQGFDWDGPVDSVSRERHRLIDGDGASPDLTRGSCSAVGASGFTGCMIRDWRAKDEQHGKY